LACSFGYAGRVETDPEIWAQATLLVARHGDAAATRVATKVDQLATLDPAANRRWLRVVQAIAWLQDRRGRDRFTASY
jgi:hypothetical protein